MSSSTARELEQFHEFVGHQLKNGEFDISPEECLDSWRAEHPSPDDVVASVAAITSALAESARGESQPAAEVIAALRAEFELPDAGTDE